MNRDQPIDRSFREKAAALLLRRDAGWTAEEAAEFALWRAADPRHDRAVREVEATERWLTQLSRTRAGAEMRAELDELCASRPRTRARTWYSVAGVFAAAACLAVAAWVFFPRAHSHGEFSAPAGQQQVLDLADGSMLRLNGGSAVDLDFRPDERHVNLKHGDVHFAVARDTTRPFVVSAGAVTIRVVGTTFAVRRETRAVEVFVSEGTVQVSRVFADPGGTAGAPITLTVGQSTRIELEPVPATVRTTAAVATQEARPASLRMEFADTPLSELVIRFNRHNRVQLELGEPELAARPIGGVFDAGNVEAFVNALLLTGEVRAERVAPDRIVLRRVR